MQLPELIADVPDYMEMVDRAEVAMVQGFPVVTTECPSTHRFTNNVYSRETLLPAGTLLTSKIHKTQHFYVILEGRGLVRTAHGSIPYEAGTVGITEPGTRRVIYAETDTRWVTFHPIPDGLTDLEEIEGLVIQEHTNPLLTEGVLLHD